MRSLVFGLTAAAVGASLCGVAQGAEKCFDKGSLSYVDCPEPAPGPAPAPAPIPVAAPEPSWTGFYLGAHAGVLSPDFDGAYSQGIDLDFNQVRAAGLMAGGQLGYLHEFDNDVVFGIEISGSFLNGEDYASEPGVLVNPDSVDVEMGYAAEARLRLGYAFDEGPDSIMPYITGGVALVAYEADIIEFTPAETVSIDETAFGGVVGAGVEFLLDEQFSIGAEGLYYFFDESTDISGVLAGAVPASREAGDSFDLDGAGVLRARLNYHF